MAQRYPTGALPSNPGQRWRDDLPDLVEQIASDWELELGDTYVPGGQCAWVAAARGPSGEELVLKVGWRHPEAEHEADGLAHWDGEGAVRCLRRRTFAEASALLLERCVPGTPLSSALPEPEQDVVIAERLARMWARPLPRRHPFRPLHEMCDAWADSFERNVQTDSRGLDPGLAETALELLRALPRGVRAGEGVLLCTDLDAGNVLAAEREPWLVIDPKPFVGDPAYDAVQHMLNCHRRLAGDPLGLSRRMAGLLDVDPERVRLWLFARCTQEALENPAMNGPARRLAP